MNSDRIIAEVAKRHGGLLSPDDPIMHIATMLELHDADHQARDQEVLAAALKEVRKAGARMVAAELPLALTRASWRLAAVGVAALVLACGASAAAGYLYRGQHLTCGFTTQDGRHWCEDGHS